MLSAVFGALFRDFSSNGCYRRSLALPKKGVMGVIGVNGAPFPLVKIDFFAFFQNFSPILKNFSLIFPNFRVMGVIEVYGALK